MSDDRTTDLVTRLRQVGCASLVDAMGRRHGHRAHLLPMVSPDPGRPLVGPAATITFLPYRDDVEDPPDFAELFYRAVGPQPEGKVLVLSSGGHPDVSHGGGTKLSRVHNHGLAGVASDGRLRDFAELARFDFATWCRGEATRWGGDTVMPHAAGQPVAFAGVCVVPGDYVYLDDSGGVVIPAADVAEVLAEAHRIEVEDSRSTDHIRAERPHAPHRGAR
ncbi:RraA family protein [Iamia sp. SCSIO 61187]|uniref:RraA family protein n=1 Tax=Iamia sp. SCSIO 61187 TaxID=2722752 RepID=UPI001C63834A|nr:RraA family protein [Iamia sp. SCSIO 61187]QYG93236.1 RraA family protein [Iamia sp. SCSIO 61187]